MRTLVRYARGVVWNFLRNWRLNWLTDSDTLPASEAVDSGCA